LACHDISFDVFPKEVLGIVGESGSGKSTVVKILNFDLEPTGGEAYATFPGLNGSIPSADLEAENLFELSAFRKRKLRDFAIGIVYQNPHLGLRMNISAGGNVAERLLMAEWRHVGNMRDRAAELLRKTEVPVERMDELPWNFSGGMQQRVQIAKALSNDPYLLLLDEVTTGLDVSVQARVLDLLRNLQKEFDLATIVVSHDLGVIRMLTTRTLVMRNGHVVETGLTDQVLEDPQHPYTQLLVGSALR
jgi:putative phosphonate transport system ATP-binding protein